MKKISVLVPVYNVESYLERCLDSIINQTFKDMEIICMDDGSTDSSGAILDRYADKDNRVRVIHKANSGYGHTMNMALDLAEGEYIGIVESDDYIALDMYEKLYEAAEQNRLDFVKTDYYQLWEREDGTEQLNYRPLTEKTELYNRVIEPNRELETYFLQKFTWNALYRKGFLQKNNIEYNETPGASYQDNGFWFQTFYFAKRAMFLAQAFYRYKQDNPNSSVNSDKKVFAMKNEYDFIRGFLEKRKEKDKRLYQICFYFRIDGCLYTLSKLADPYKLQLAEVIQEDCDLYERMGEADFNQFPRNVQDIIWKIRKNPTEYVEGQIRGRKKIRENLKGYSYIVVYGAGSYGKSVYEKIKCSIGKNSEIEFAVTDLKGEKQYYYSKVIKEITDFIKKKEDCLVILSVKYDTKAYCEMERTLQEMNFKNIVSYQDIISWEMGNY